VPQPHHTACEKPTSRKREHIQAHRDHRTLTLRFVVSCVCAAGGAYTQKPVYTRGGTYTHPLCIRTTARVNTPTRVYAPLPAYTHPPRIRTPACVHTQAPTRVYAPSRTCVYAPTPAYKHVCVNAASGAYTHLPAYTHPTLRPACTQGRDERHVTESTLFEIATYGTRDTERLI
jgi:hypothetical protein